jgi:3-oxoacyl-[acyl-carrier-protein] synthase-3
MPYADIIGIGSYLPERVLTNADLEAMVDTSDEWITTRTGIRERRLAAEGEATSHLAIEASRKALEDAGVGTDEIDLIIIGTSSPDMLMPSTACIVQAAMGMTCPAYDVNAACSGFVYGLHAAAATIESGRARTVLLVGADALSRFVDFSDRTTCVLFGDGARSSCARARSPA